MAIIYELTKEQKTILNPETHATLATRHRTHLSKTQPQKNTTKKTKNKISSAEPTRNWDEEELVKWVVMYMHLPKQLFSQ
jgi:hypothetical protein